jgi:UDP-N-acetylmuramate--alanine ligase
MQYDNIYFLGIGGIGMSAIARYFMHEGRRVGGYDRTPTDLTHALESEGAEIHYTDDSALIPARFRNPDDTLVVFTPAIPHDSAELNWFIDNGFIVEKRSEMLGHITEGKYVMAVAGTHGKTTTTTLTAWLNHNAAEGGKGGDGSGSAFLGGISKNFGSNLVLGTGRRVAVEADEFDRSFLRLNPDVAVITSTDADHLDIYGTPDAMREAFAEFAGKIKAGGALIKKLGAEITVDRDDIAIYSYSLEEATDFHAANITLADGGHYGFDIVCPDRVIKGCTLGVPGLINIENAVAAVALMWVAGFNERGLKRALESFSGVKRRFDFHINTPEVVYVDDYAHHPAELLAAISSIRKMFPERKFLAIFQPHLYTRTRDFYREFAEALSMADEVILAPIYPARELPIAGVNSDMIAELVTAPVTIINKEDIAEELNSRDADLIATFGAGDIDNHCHEIAAVLQQRIKSR